VNYAIIDSHRQTTRNFCRSYRFPDKIFLNFLSGLGNSTETDRQTDRQTVKQNVLSARSSFFS